MERAGGKGGRNACKLGKRGRKELAQVSMKKNEKGICRGDHVLTSFLAPHGPQNESKVHSPSWWGPVGYKILVVPEIVCPKIVCPK